jgi:hypothetical protein
VSSPRRRRLPDGLRRSERARLHHHGTHPLLQARPRRARQHLGLLLPTDQRRRLSLALRRYRRAALSADGAHPVLQGRRLRVRRPVHRPRRRRLSAVLW